MRKREINELSQISISSMTCVNKNGVLVGGLSLVGKQDKNKNTKLFPNTGKQERSDSAATRRLSPCTKQYANTTKDENQSP